jgi:hypothetical protein
MTRIATVYFLGQPIAAVDDGDLPYALNAQLFWQDQERRLTVVDQQGQSTSYDFAVVPISEASCAALSLRISAEGALQADCLLGKAAIPNPDDFLFGLVRGLRLQPILLPGLSSSPGPSKGQGLFARGLHYPGILTRSNVSLLCLCDECRASFRLQPFHSGFAQSEYYYCNTGLHTLVIDDASLSRVSAGSVTLESAQAEIERLLPPCRACHEAFQYLNPLRCPHCLSPYIDFRNHPEIRKGEYYGNYFFGTSTQHLTEDDSSTP